MQSLWAAVVSGAANEALPSFFPEAAYLQVKDISNPASDWQGRLIVGFSADIAAAHSLLGVNAPYATFVSVEVPEAYAHWVLPGTCYNRVGYYEVPNARVVYQVNGQTMSFGIASMISWRGEWFVVHLGAVLETAGQGTVDAPATGPGTSAPSSTC